MTKVWSRRESLSPLRPLPKLGHGWLSSGPYKVYCDGTLLLNILSLLINHPCTFAGLCPQAMMEIAAERHFLGTYGGLWAYLIARLLLLAWLFDWASGKPQTGIKKQALLWRNHIGIKVSSAPKVFVIHMDAHQRSPYVWPWKCNQWADHACQLNVETKVSSTIEQKTWDQSPEFMRGQPLKMWTISDWAFTHGHVARSLNIVKG